MSFLSYRNRVKLNIMNRTNKSGKKTHSKIERRKTD